MMLAQYLVSLGATKSQKDQRGEATKLPILLRQPRAFHDHMLVEGLCILFISEYCNSASASGSFLISS